MKKPLILLLALCLLLAMVQHVSKNKKSTI